MMLLNDVARQLYKLQTLVMQVDDVQPNVHAITRTCLLCGARSVVSHTTENVAAEVAKTPHDPSCMFGMLWNPTLWVAGPPNWSNLGSGVRVFPVKDLITAAKEMARRVVDGTFTPGSRRVFLALNFPLAPEFEDAYEAEKQRRGALAKWEKGVQYADRLRAYSLGLLRELNLGDELDEQIRAKVEETYPYPPKPEMEDK